MVISMLESLFAQLASPMEVPPVPSYELQGEPLQPTTGVVVPLVPPVLSKKDTIKPVLEIFSNSFSFNSLYVTCEHCLNFIPTHPHGRGVGTCGSGIKGKGSSSMHWHNDLHECNQYVQLMQ